MLCPNCKKEMIVVERQKIELDYCLFCKGFWFDNNEWNLLSQRFLLQGEEPLGDLYSIPKAIVKEKNKKCPVCNENMEKFILFNVVLDRCPKKHGVWFDEKEVSSVFNLSSGKKASLANFLGEMFYKNRI